MMLREISALLCDTVLAQYAVVMCLSDLCVNRPIFLTISTRPTWPILTSPREECEVLQ